MKLGYFNMPMHPPGSNFTKTLHDDLEQIEVLDTLGYSEAWIGEHFTAEWENIPSPDLFIASALNKTKNIKLGTGVTCMPNHNPFLLAHRIAQLDHMAKGRFLWGVGSGGFPGDFDVAGIDPKTGEHRTMAREALDLILSLWKNPKVGNYKNKYWDFNVPNPEEEIGLRFWLKPYQLPHPPIAVAGVSENSDTLTLAGERGYIPMSINLMPTKIVKSHWDTVEKGAQSTGAIANRNQWRIARNVFVADSSEDAYQLAVNGIIGRDWDNYFMPLLCSRKINKEHTMMHALKNDPLLPDSAITKEYMAENIWIIGNPDEVANKIRELYNQVGGFGTLLIMGSEWSPRAEWIRSHELLSTVVLDKLHDLG
tara:strand:+ start:1227 stop:2327 length:1101 start_codon:yes stop_codon:yes gene_type:complete